MRMPDASEILKSSVCIAADTFLVPAIILCCVHRALLICPITIVFVRAHSHYVRWPVFFFLHWIKASHLKDT